MAQTLGGNLGQQSGLIQKLLPILAPIVLAYISKRLTGGSQVAGRPARLIRAARGGIRSPTCSARILGGGQSGRPAAGASGSILDMLGGLLGRRTPLAVAAAAPITA